MRVDSLVEPLVSAGRRLRAPRLPDSVLATEVGTQHGLAVLVGVSITLLGVLRVAGSAAPLEALLQVVLVASFVALAARDLRLAAGVMIFELALGGAGGQWTELPGGVSGRNFLLGVVIGRAAVTLAPRLLERHRLGLGRYGGHALALAVLLPVIWVPLGIANGYGASNALADGNAALFLAFALVVVLLVETGSARWLRRCLFAACAANAVFLAAVIALTASGLVSLSFAETALLRDLDMGGSIGRLGDGTYRLYVGSGLYLQVGLALTTWYLLSRPRSGLLWSLFALLWLDVIASYTRGYWIAAFLSVAIVVAAGSPSPRAALHLVAPSAALATVAIMTALAAGFLSTSSLTERLESLAGSFDTEGDRPSQLPPAPPPRAGTSGAPAQPGLYLEIGPWRDQAIDQRPRHSYQPRGTFARPQPKPGVLSESEASDRVREHQASVLWGHIKERPITGRGFGALAPDYRYSNGYTYELTYLSLLFKTGLIGTLLFLSLPLRLLFDAARARLRRLTLADGASPFAAAVPIAILTGLLLLGATNPYLLAAFGLSPIVLCIAWLGPGPEDVRVTGAPRESRTGETP